MAMILGLIVSITTDYVKRILDAVERHASYSFHFNNYVNELEEEKIKLESTMENVLNCAEREKSNNKAMNNKIAKQLENAKSLTKEVEDLGQKAKGDQSYCFWHCPNFTWRYRVGKQSAKKAIVLKELNESLERFEEFARAAPLPGVSYFSSEGFILFDSTKKAYEELLMALNNEEVSMIGLHAMGGSGKTILVKQVGKEVEKNFEKVAFAVVSNNIDVKRIQGELASYLGLSLTGKETLTERARSLSLRLTSGEKFLIILDDVWEKLDFEAIGIPFGENCKNCIVLLTTRRVQVCTLMGCQRKIPLSLLAEEDAWILFQKHSEIANKTSDSLNDTAIKIAKECHGLPVAIVAVASTLKGKTKSEWMEALEKLREATPVNIEEGLRNPYTCLQLSYDMLKSETTKSLFLLCSVFPEDYEIHEEYLARYGIGLGLFGNLRSYKRARNQVSEAKNILLDSSLLLKAKKKQYVKMHDLVRDVAPWIAKKENKMIVRPQSSGELLKSNETFEANKIRYLWFDELKKLPYTLSYPKLEFLRVKVSEMSILPNEVFKEMEELRVLILHNENSWEMNPIVAKSIQWPTNLHCLFLEGLELEDISFLSSLKKLEALVLWHCSFDGLPEEIAELERLKLLDLRECKIEKNPYEVIQMCSKLEELYFVQNKGSRWEQEGQVAALLLDKNKAISGLQRYRIDIGTSHAFDEEDFSITRGLGVTNFDASTCTATIKDLAKSAQVLQLENINEKGWKNLIPHIHEAIGGGMNVLENLYLYESDTIECLIDTSNHLLEANTVFSKLVRLQIVELRCLETLWRGPVLVEMLNQFRSLKELKLLSCPNLTSVFTHVVAQSFILLEELIIQCCDSLKHIITDDQEMKSSTSMFPKLKRINIGECNELEYLVSISFARGFPQLESLEIRTCGKLKEVFREFILSSHEDQNESGFQIIDLPMLKELNLYDLPNMIYVCSESHCLRCPSLNVYNMFKCQNLRVLVDDSQAIITQQGDTPIKEQNSEIVVMVEAAFVQNLEKIKVVNCNVESIFQLCGLPINRELALTLSLKRLELFDLDELMYIFKGPGNFISLANLETLDVFHCKKLKYIFSACIMRGLPRLEMLLVEDCDQLEQIIENGKPQNSKGSSNFVFPHTYQNPGTSVHDDYGLQNCASMFPRLKDFRVNDCNSLKYVLPFPFARGLQKLEKLMIRENEQLKHIFSQCNHQNFLSYQSQHKILIEFPALKEMFISGLSNITSNCYFKCPSLEIFYLHSIGLRITSMNDMMIGSELRLCIHNMTQKTREHEKDEIRLDGEDDVLHIIRQLQRLEIGNCKIDTVFHLEGLIPICTREGGLVFNLSYLRLENIFDLTFLCKGPTQSLNLNNLKDLQVVKCRKLKTIFSLPILRSFPHLKYITIKECDALEQVIEEDENDQCSSNYQHGQVCFPRLIEIVIEKCDNLNCLFTILSPHELPQLERLCIAKCSLLKNVFALKGSEVEDGQAIRLPMLTLLDLIKLPNLVNIFEGFSLQFVEFLEVNDCPKLTFNDVPVKFQILEEEGKRLEEESELEGSTPSTPSLDDTPLFAIKASTSDNADAVQKISSSISKQDLDDKPQASLKEAFILNEEDQRKSSNKKMEPILNFPIHHDENIKNRIGPSEETIPQISDLCPQSIPEDLQPEKVTQSEKPYNQYDPSTKSDKGRGESQTQDTPQSLQEQNISLKENKKEIEKGNHQKGHAAEETRSPISSLEFVGKQAINELVLADQQALELNQVTIELIERAYAASEVEHTATDHANNSVSKASTTKELQNVARNSPISQDFSSTANAEVSPQNMPCRLNHSNSTETTVDFPKLGKDSYLGPEKKGKNVHQLDDLNIMAGSSGEATMELPCTVPVDQNVAITTSAVDPSHIEIEAPLSSLSLLPIPDPQPEVEEYAAFRDIGAIKKKHIPLLEQAIAIHPSFWAWHERFKIPEMRQFGYTMLGKMMELLASTRWTDLTENKKAEFESIIDVLETLGFDAEWLRNIRAMIKQRNLDEEAINSMRTLEKLVAAQEIELRENRLKLDAIRARLGNVDDFIGF